MERVERRVREDEPDKTTVRPAVETAAIVRVEIVGIVEEDEKGQALLCELLAVFKGDFAHHGPVVCQLDAKER